MANVSVSGGELRTPVGDAPVIPLAILGIGMYLAWFGVHYWRSGVKWPSDPVKSVLQGKPLPAASPPPSYSAQLTADVTALGADAGSTAAGSTGGGSGSGSPAASSYNVQTLQTLWTSNGGAQGTSFEAANIGMAESGGDPRVTSPNPDGGTNVGLWQLDTKGVGAGYTEAQLMDPDTNARITIMATANGTKWTEWADSVVSNGVYTGPKG